MKKFILLLFTLLLLPTEGYATPDKRAMIARLREELATVKTNQDSIKILYDIFDLSSRRDYMNVCKELDAVAARGGDNTVRFDMARQMANVGSSDSVLADIERRVRTLPDCKEKKETALFVKIRRSSSFCSALR